MDKHTLFRLLTESVFVFVGLFLVWVGMAGRYLFFNPRRAGWLVLAVVLILWGLNAWRRSRLQVVRSEKLITRVRAGSLATLGLIMLALAWAPYRTVGLLLAAAGAVLVVRGLVTAGFAARSS